MYIYIEKIVWVTFGMTILPIVHKGNFNFYIKCSIYDSINMQECMNLAVFMYILSNLFCRHHFFNENMHLWRHVVSRGTRWVFLYFAARVYTDLTCVLYIRLFCVWIRNKANRSFVQAALIYHVVASRRRAWQYKGSAGIAHFNPRKSVLCCCW